MLRIFILLGSQLRVNRIHVQLFAPTSWLVFYFEEESDVFIGVVSRFPLPSTMHRLNVWISKVDENGRAVGMLNPMRDKYEGMFRHRGERGRHL